MTRATGSSLLKKKDLKRYWCCVTDTLRVWTVVITIHFAVFQHRRSPASIHLGRKLDVHAESALDEFAAGPAFEQQLIERPARPFERRDRQRRFRRRTPVESGQHRTRSDPVLYGGPQRAVGPSLTGRNHCEGRATCPSRMRHRGRIPKARRERRPAREQTQRRAVGDGSTR